MHRSILTVITGLLAFCLLPATAIAAPLPQSASAALYAKVQGEDVLVAIEVTPDFGWWFYDDGPGDVGGQPTKITLGGLDDAEWGLWFPEPKVKVQEEYDLTSKIFDDTTLLYGIARGMGAEAELEDLTAEIDGQLCDKHMCVPWNPSLSLRGEGTEAHWAGFPSAFLAGKADGSMEGAVDETGSSALEPKANRRGRQRSQPATVTNPPAWQYRPSHTGSRRARMGAFWRSSCWPLARASLRC